MSSINPISDGYYKVSLGTPVGKVEGNVLLYTDYRLDEELKIGIEYGKVKIEYEYFGGTIKFYSLEKLIP